MSIGRPAENPVTRFMRYVRVVENGCHEWQSKRDRAGYGQFTLKSGCHVRAHRFAWMIAYGEIPTAMLVCHHCDNPSCVNPEHLFIGTYSDNAKDMVAKGRNVGRIKLSKKDVLHIRGLLKQGAFSQDFIAKMYGVDQTTISDIKLAIPAYVKKALENI